VNSANPHHFDCRVGGDYLMAIRHINPCEDAVDKKIIAEKICRFTSTSKVEVDGYDHREDEAVQITAEQLRGASVFAWEPDIAEAVFLASRSIPDDAHFDTAWLTEPVWWFFRDWKLHIGHLGTSVPIDDPIRKQYDSENICAVCVFKANGSVWIADFKLTTDGFAPIFSALYGCEETTTISELSKADSQMRATVVGRFVMAGLAWLSQRIAVAESQNIERHKRKRLFREYGVIPDTKVVRLRRSDSRDSQSAGGNTEWSCRWVVNGHWRNQPYKDNQRKLIYILPYVKGPDDKPLKAPSTTVFAVSR
jgi:hypothetical protein